MCANRDVWDALAIQQHVSQTTPLINPNFLFRPQCECLRYHGIDLELIEVLQSRKQ